MIIIPFVPGAFGSTVEYIIRAFTSEYKSARISSNINDNGSMHSYYKLNHIVNTDLLTTCITKSLGTNTIVTPIYPLKDMHAKETIETIEKHASNFDSIVLLYIDSLEYAEINILFQYYKIAVAYFGLDLFFGNSTNNIANWNSSYTNWKDMKRWELREWFSLYYEVWVQEWIDICKYSKRGLKVSTREMLDDTLNVLRKIINYCNLTEDIQIDQFVKEWRTKQQYVLDEYELINNIVKFTINGEWLEWPDLNIISESIIQRKLRNHGFEIKCFGLNSFPTDSFTLKSILESS